MSTTVGMGVKKKDEKGADARLKKELKELAAANKGLQKENAALHDRIEELEAAGKEVPAETPAE